MDGSFANQVLAQIHLYQQQYASLSAEQKRQALRVEVLPKQLDEEVARYMVEGFGGVLTRLTEKQARYLGVPIAGPYKPHEYRY